MDTWRSNNDNDEHDKNNENLTYSWPVFVIMDANPLQADSYLEIQIVFCTVPLIWKGKSSWNPSSWMTRNYLSYTVNTMATDDLVMQGARWSAAMVLT